MFVVGTAGHVDHGKSTLVRALTGIDPDRLAEEKARGLTIDLGFAWTTLPSGREIGIVDVPGHERFVHNMLAGAGSVDAVVFVVDANEGWRTQSEEHLAIVDLLGIPRGVIALTKIDQAPDRGRAAAEQVRERLAGTTLSDAPAVEVSAVTGEGMDALRAAIDEMLGAAPLPLDRERPRLFVDRSFTIKGAGTVVTGTLTGGRLREGQEVEILPSGIRTRIRSLQTHRSGQAQATPTSRVALNLAGIDREAIGRGDAVVAPGSWRATRTLDVLLRGVRSLDHPVRARGAYVVHAGTSQTPAKLSLLDTAELAAGGEAAARLRLDAPVVVQAGDRIVLRDAGRRATVAGGVVLDAHPPPRPTGNRAAQLRLRAEASGDPSALAECLVRERGVVAAADLIWLAGVDAAPQGATRLPSYVVSDAWLEHARVRLRSLLDAFHRDRPLERGVPRESLRGDAGFDDARLFDETLSATTDVAQEGPLVRLAAHRVTLSPHMEAARSALESELDAAGFSPPALAELAARYGEALVKALIDARALVKVSAGIVYAPATLAAAKDAIAAAASAEGPLTASRIRALLGTSRKWAIPLLEYLDATGFTRRDGDVRTVRSP